MPGAGYSPGQNFDATKPAGATELQDADNDITDNQKHQDNAYAVEHYAPSDDPDASEDDFGRHDYISLKEQASKPDLSGSAVRHALYAKDDGLYFENVDGTETKIFDLTNNWLANLPKIEIFDIGDWNMDETESAQIDFSGLTYSKIRSVSVLIRDDNDDNKWSFETEANTGVTGSVQIDESTSLIILRRTLNGIFDSASFNSTSYNRGWVTVTYTV